MSSYLSEPQRGFGETDESFAAMFSPKFTRQPPRSRLVPRTFFSAKTARDRLNESTRTASFC